MQADEDVGLGQIGSIQLPRRVQSSPSSNITGVSSAISPSVELTKTRNRWSGVRIVAVMVRNARAIGGPDRTKVNSSTFARSSELPDRSKPVAHPLLGSEDDRAAAVV